MIRSHLVLAAAVPVFCLSCAGGTQGQHDLGTTVGAPTTSTTGTASTAPTPTSSIPESFLATLATELSRLGLADEQVACIAAGLAAVNLDPGALGAGELTAVRTLDEVAQRCDVDLLDYIE